MKKEGKKHKTVSTQTKPIRHREPPSFYEHTFPTTPLEERKCYDEDPVVCYQFSCCLILSAVVGAGCCLGTL